MCLMTTVRTPTYNAGMLGRYRDAPTGEERHEASKYPCPLALVLHPIELLRMLGRWDLMSCRDRDDITDIRTDEQFAFR